MKVLTVPRTAVALEYKVLRLPASVVEKRVVSRFLADDNVIRLGFERALGTMDRGAGRLLSDDALTRRGEALIGRADVLAKAVTLEKEAAATRAEADEQVHAEQDAADEQREQATKHRAAEKAAARIGAETQAIDRDVDATLSAQEQRLERTEESIEARTAARTAAPKAQLGDAVEAESDADRERETAERLGDLADQEKNERQEAREQRVQARREARGE